MNQYLKNILDILQQNKTLSDADKEALIKAIADADKQWNITDFKLERTEKVKKTTAVLLEETITELEQKRKSVEAQKRELEIESSLERVRSRMMAMQRSDELEQVVDVVFERLKELHVELYTAIIVIFDEDSKDVIWWMQNKVNQQYSRIQIGYADKAYLRDLFEARQRGEDFFSKCY